MTDPEDINEAVPAAVWDQDMPVGGADVQGRLPAVAAPVVNAGISTVREVPTLKHVTGVMSLTQAGLPQRVGRENRRRRLILSVSASEVTDAYVVAGDSQQQTQVGYGLEIPAGTILVLGTAGELWFDTFGDDLRVSWLAELDQG